MLNLLIQFLNSSRFFAACLMLTMNIGGRFISKDIPDYIYNIFEFSLARAVTVFAIAFIASRDIKTSIIITLIFIILFKYLLNEESNVCVLTPEMRNSLDFNKDGKVSEAELKRASEIIEKYRHQKTPTEKQKQK